MNDCNQDDMSVDACWAFGGVFIKVSDVVSEYRLC